MTINYSDNTNKTNYKPEQIRFQTWYFPGFLHHDITEILLKVYGVKHQKPSKPSTEKL